MNAQVIVLKTILKFTLLPNTATYALQQGPTNICSNITTGLITHQCTIIDYFNKV